MAILFEHTDYGESAAVSVGDAAIENNIQIALYQRYSSDLTDFKELTDAIQLAKPNVIYLISSQTKQAQGILQSIKALISTSAVIVPTNTPTARPTATSTPVPTITPTKTPSTGTPKPTTKPTTLSTLLGH